MKSPLDLTNLGAKCLVCGGALRHVFAVPYLRLPGTCQFLACQVCESIFDAARLLDEHYIGSNTQYTQSDIKFYVEYGAGIEHFAMLIGILRHVFSILPAPVTRPQFLDVGAAFGFAVSMAKDCGWEALGIEPSSFGKIGGQLLDVRIIPDYLGNAHLGEECFDCIVISDVIEHVGQPGALIASALKLLKPSGILLLTTPNSEVVTQSLESEITDVLSPGYHLTIFSPPGLNRVLIDNQVKDARFFFQGGASGRKAMIVLATRAKGILPLDLPWAQITTEAKTRTESYLMQLVARKERAGQKDMLYRGALFRMLEKKTVQGDYPRAYPIQRQLEGLHGTSDWPEERLSRIAQLDFASLVQELPAYSGLFHFYSGLLKLEHLGDFTAASREFHIAKRLFQVEKQTRIFPRTGWPEKACYYEAVALLKAGNPKAAMLAFQVLVDAPHDVPVELWEQIHINRAVANWRLSRYISALQNLMQSLRMRLAKISSRIINNVSKWSRTGLFM